MNTMSAANEITRVRDLSPTAVRLRPELKVRLAREAAISGRTMHAEILFRIVQGLDSQALYSTGQRDPLLAKEVVKGWTYQLPDAERKLLTRYRALSPERQLALLTLID